MRKTFMKAVAVMSAILLSGALCVNAMEINTYSEKLTVYYDGEDVYANSENKPCIINDRTMVPLRPVFEAMGWKNESINYDEATQTVHFQGGDASCTFVNNSNIAMQNWSDGTKKEHVLDVPATIHNGNFYIPLRAFCEMWGNDIEWNNSERRVYISTYYDSDTDSSYVENEPVSDEADLMTEDEAVAFVQEYIGDSLYANLEYSFEYENTLYYQVAAKAKITDNEATGEYHMTKMTSYIVSADSSEIFEGYYNQDTKVLTNYEDEVVTESMEQE